jgi:aldehyde reductase
MTKIDPSVKVEDSWRGMEGVYEKGLAKAIGVSNFNDEQIERIQKVAKVPIHNSQVELHLYFNQAKHVATCKKHNISVTAYAPLGSPGNNL